jgi:hypothetical protein
VSTRNGLRVGGSSIYANRPTTLADLLGDALSWQDGSELCAQVDPELFYSDLQGSRYVEARALCARCPSRAACLQAALDNREPYGLWGGTTPKQRAAMLREAA